MRRLARRPTVLHDRTIFAVVGIVLGCGIEKVGRRHPVDAVRNVRFFVRVVAQLAIGIRIVRVVAHPLHRDVPVAVAQNAGDHFAARVERVGEPARGSHKGIFAVRAPDRTDDLGRILGPELLELAIETGQKVRRAIAHDIDEVHALRGVRLAIMERFGERDQLGLHGISVVLTRDLEVDAHGAHQASLRRLHAAARVVEARLGVPGHLEQAYFSGLQTARLNARQIDRRRRTR